MTLPAIRYPLPTFVAVVALLLAFWWGADWIGRIQAELGRRVEAIVTDQVPTTANPDWTTAPIPRQGLLLHDDQPILDQPNGRTALTLGKRRTVEILNVWPLRGKPAHYLVGQDKPLGWIPAEALLPWDTRLIVRPPQQGLSVAGGTIPFGSPPLPITAIDSSSESLTLAEWDSEHPWSNIQGVHQVKLAEIPPESLEILVTRGELLALLPLLRTRDTPTLRSRAALGRLIVDATKRISPEAEASLAPVFRQAGGFDPSALVTLGRLNDQWRPDTTWNSGECQGIPIRLIP